MKVLNSTEVSQISGSGYAEENACRAAYTGTGAALGGYLGGVFGAIFGAAAGAWLGATFC